MIRNSGQSLSRALLRASPRHAPRPAVWVRAQSNGPPPSGGGGGKVLIGLGLTSLALVGGGVAFAGNDPEFRRLAEETLPGAATILGVALGPVEPAQPSPPPVNRASLATSTPPSRKRPSVVEAVAPPAQADPPSFTTPPAPPLEQPTYLDPVAAPEAAEAPSPTPTLPAQPVAEPVQTSVEPPAAPAEPIAPVEPKPVPLAQTRAEVERVQESESIRAGQDLYRRLASLRGELEIEMKTQLKRQAEAHSDHIQDSLDVQRQELTRKFVRELDETLESATLKQREELAGIVGHLQGLQVSLAARATMDMASLEAQELWLACASLQAALDDSTWLAEVRPLKRELDFIQGLLKTGVADDYVKTVVDAIPSQAETRGVFTDSTIKERFIRVENMARRTALIGAEGGSLVAYGLSYLQSLFIVNPSTESMPNPLCPVNVDELSTFDIVWLARASLDRGDLEQAVKYMNLLQGTPQKVAHDWIKEAQILLETKQAAKALLLHAAAIGVEALPQRKPTSPPV